MAQFFKPAKKIKRQERAEHFIIERLDHHGCGVATHQNQIYFIPRALPQEKVRAQVVERKKKYARAKLLGVIEPSAQRVVPKCVHFDRCGGCDMQHVSWEEQKKHKSTALLSILHKFADVKLENVDSVLAGQPWHYRRRARLALRYDKQSSTVTLGFRSKQSSDIVSIHDCPILETSLNALIEPLEVMLQRLSMKKNIGHVELLQTKSQPWILLRVIGNVSQSDRDIVQRFCQSQGINGAFLKDNQEIEHLFEESLPTYESLNDISLSFQPNHFIQVNNDVNKKMIQQAIDWLDVKKSDVVLDLFCGVGNFSLPLAQHVKKVIGIEGVQVMVDQATANAQRLGFTQAEFFQADLNVDNLSKYVPEGVDKVLLDPSRQGAYEILKNVQHLMPTHIVYVSCDPVTLARDTSYLLEQGYQLNKVSMIDMFPQTRHIESMVLFKKISKRSS